MKGSSGRSLADFFMTLTTVNLDSAECVKAKQRAQEFQPKLDGWEVRAGVDSGWFQGYRTSQSDHF